MKFFFALALILGLGIPALSQETLVFEANKEGHAIYRIPAIINLPNGDLLGIC
jgi:sialidase-1